MEAKKRRRLTTFSVFIASLVIKLSTRDGEPESVVAGGQQLDLLLHGDILQLGHLHLGHGGLGHLHLGVGVGQPVAVGVAQTSVGVGQAGVGQDGGGGGGLGGGLLIGGALAAGLALLGAGHGQVEGVDAAGLLDGVGDDVVGDLDLLDDGLDHVGGVGVGEGGAEGVGVAEVLSGGGCHQDGTHQQGLHDAVFRLSSVCIVSSGCRHPPI